MSKRINESALSTDINKISIESINKKINENGEIIDSIVNDIVKSYCQELDNYMQFIKSILDDNTNPPTDRELDDFTLNLPVLLYFVGQSQETLGVKEDISKAIKQEKYNEYYDKATGTISDKTAISELATQNEYISNIVYQRAYKKVKLRMEAGFETLQSIKKVITRRGQEYELTRIK